MGSLPETETARRAPVTLALLATSHPQALAGLTRFVETSRHVVLVCASLDLVLTALTAGDSKYALLLCDIGSEHEACVALEKLRSLRGRPTATPVILIHDDNLAVDPRDWHGAADEIMPRSIGIARFARILDRMLDNPPKKGRAQ